MSFLSPSLRLENLPRTPTISQDHIGEAERYNPANIVASWRVPINGRPHRIEFEHGHTSGRRMIWVNGKEVLRRDWMFRLVGEDTFYIDECRCILRVEPAPAYQYDYSLFVDNEVGEAERDEDVGQSVEPSEASTYSSIASG